MLNMQYMRIHLTRIECTVIYSLHMALGKLS